MPRAFREEAVFQIDESRERSEAAQQLVHRALAVCERRRKGLPEVDCQLKFIFDAEVTDFLESASLALFKWRFLFLSRGICSYPRIILKRCLNTARSLYRCRQLSCVHTLSSFVSIFNGLLHPHCSFLKARSYSYEGSHWTKI